MKRAGGTCSWASVLLTVALGALTACSGGSDEPAEEENDDGTGGSGAGDGDDAPPTPPAEFECGSFSSCQTVSEYCLAVWDGGPSPDAYGCQPIPTPCTDEALTEMCACIMEEEGDLTECVVSEDTTIRARYDR